MPSDCVDSRTLKERPQALNSLLEQRQGRYSRPWGSEPREEHGLQKAERMLISPRSWVPYLFDLTRMTIPALDYVGTGDVSQLVEYLPCMHGVPSIA